jgi:hypothetical protein
MDQEGIILYEVLEIMNCFLVVRREIFFIDASLALLWSKFVILVFK